MIMGTINFCYENTTRSKFAVMATLKKFFEERRNGGYINYIPITDNRSNIETTMSLYDGKNVVFVSVRELNSTMQFAFKHSIDMGERRVVSTFNGTVYDYATHVVKELLLDDDSAVVEQAIQLAREYRLCSMSRMPFGYHELQSIYFHNSCDIKKCGKALAEAIA